MGVTPHGFSDFRGHDAANPDMMIFFSNRLGCLGSVAISLVGTAVLILIFAR